MFQISRPATRHADDIENLLDRAFGPNRQSKRSYAFRDGIGDIEDLRFITLKGKELVGTIRFWPIAIGAHGFPALLLGPLGVDPDHQGEGIGAGLIHHGLEVAREQGHKACVLVGDLTYYGRFGFGLASQHHIHMPGEQDHRVLIRELENGALTGVEGAILKADGTDAAAA